MTGRRLESGGTWIDRSRPIRFAFDGRDVDGFAGDTVASALLASGERAGFVSPLQGRARGIVTAGVEEPNAFVEISEPWFEPIRPATMVNVVDGLRVASRAGVGLLPDAPIDPRPARHVHRHVEVLVIGAGAAGRVAALEAAALNGRVLLIDEHHIVLEPPAGVTTLANTTASGIYDDGYVLCYQRDGAHDVIHHVRAERVVLAAGAHERPLAFVGNDRPGVMLASAARSYLDRFGVLVGQHIVVFSANHAGHETAEALHAVGAQVVVVDPSPKVGKASERLRAAGIEVHRNAQVVATGGDPALREVTMLGADGHRSTLLADVLAVSGGWNPTVQLARGMGVGVAYDEAKACFVHDGTGPPWLHVVGAAAGDVPAAFPIWVIDDGDDAEKYVEPQRDQTVADVARAVSGGLTSAEHVKRATYIGTTIDQGRTSGVLTAEVVNRLLGWAPGAQGPTNARPPYTPVPFSALAGIDGGPTLLDPIRATPIHDWHEARGAVYENVGQWKRPRFFPGDGEDMDAAVARECRAVRTGVGVLDASTLGKIDVCGPDAGLFLDRMYTNRMSNVTVGSIRYGLMLGLDGMVFDDGVAMRLAEDRYVVTTTTGGAAAVMDRFEEWLQTEWTDLRVYCTSVTEQWAVVAVGGPKAREVVAAAGTDIDLDNEAFAFMRFRDGSVADVPVRMCRISFTGELSYELHVSPWHAQHVWESAMAAGEPFGITPYGTEAMHVLRAEKGYVIAGQETDGTQTPDDLGMGWIVNPGKGDFVGKRSLVRSDIVREDRKHLVGLLTEDPAFVLPEGTQIVEAAEIPAPPAHMLGWVTSSYASEAAGTSIALALVERGRERRGGTVHAVLGDRTMPCTVTDPIFYDVEGARRDG
ncbi:MAG: 2Fe-2S iron-sulfur cluster-binding protein [Actinomycetota bacterium]